VVVHIYNTSTWEAKAETAWVQGQPELLGLSQKKKNKRDSAICHNMDETRLTITLSEISQTQK
jgi:hypothetical protein